MYLTPSWPCAYQHSTQHDIIEAEKQIGAHNSHRMCENQRKLTILIQLRSIVVIEVEKREDATVRVTD